jgi:hypothetical protein
LAHDRTFLSESYLALSMIRVFAGNAAVIQQAAAVGKEKKCRDRESCSWAGDNCDENNVTQNQPKKRRAHRKGEKYSACKLRLITSNGSPELLGKG